MGLAVLPRKADYQADRRLLIECWMAAEWGFYKFPLNSGVDLPELDTELLWPEIELEKLLLKEEEQHNYDFNHRFDLCLPVEMQFEDA